MSCPLVISLEIKASLVAARHDDFIRVTGNRVSAHYYVSVCVDLSAVSFHCLSFCCVIVYGFAPLDENTKLQNETERKKKDKKVLQGRLRGNGNP